MNPDEIILNHYQMVAKNFGLRAESAMEDRIIKNSEIKFFSLEIEALKKKLNRPIKVLDVGCGNGHTLISLAERFSEDLFFGVEFTPELYDLAAERKAQNYQVFHGDCRDPNFFTEPVDFIITERVLINLLTLPGRNQAVANITNLLSPGGRFVMSESFAETLQNLNQARKEFRLDELKQSKQNVYLRENVVEYIEQQGFKEIQGSLDKHYLSTHFYMTRVIHKVIRPEGGKFKFTEFEKFFHMALPAAIGEYSPIQFRVLEKI